MTFTIPLELIQHLITVILVLLVCRWSSYERFPDSNDFYRRRQRGVFVGSILLLLVAHLLLWRLS